jgi:site-specific recombinase XerD
LFSIDPEMARRLIADDSDTHASRRGSAMLALIYTASAWLPSMSLSMRYCDVWERDGGIIAIVARERAQERTVPLPSGVTGILAAFDPEIGHREDDELIFAVARGRVVWNILDERSRRLGLSVTVTSGMLRRACAAHLAEAGMPLEAIMQFLGLKRAQTALCWIAGEPGR